MIQDVQRYCLTVILTDIQPCGSQVLGSLTNSSFGSKPSTRRGAKCCNMRKLAAVSYFVLLNYLEDEVASVFRQEQIFQNILTSSDSFGAMQWSQHNLKTGKNGVLQDSCDTTEYF